MWSLGEPRFATGKARNDPATVPTIAAPGAPLREPVEPRELHPSARHVCRALRDALQRGDLIRRESVLHDAVRVRARLQRARGQTPERIFLEMEQLIREAGRGGADETENEEFKCGAAAIPRSILSWRLEAYFRHTVDG